jgi:hypothetical protein
MLADCCMVIPKAIASGLPTEFVLEASSAAEDGKKTLI